MHLSTLGNQEYLVPIPHDQTMHVHPVFRVTHGLCAKYLLKKKKRIEILKKQQQQKTPSLVNSSHSVSRSCSQVEVPEGQFFKCSTVLARRLHVDIEGRVQVLPGSQSSMVSLEALRDSLVLQRCWPSLWGSPARAGVGAGVGAGSSCTVLGSSSRGRLSTDDSP